MRHRRALAHSRRSRHSRRLRRVGTLVLRRTDRLTRDELSRTNLGRLRWLVWLMTCLTGSYALAFWLHAADAGTPQSAWQQRVAQVHAAFCLWWILLGIARRLAVARPIRHGLTMALQWVVPAGTLVFCGALAAIDQSVTAGISAYVIGSIATSVIVLMPPRTALAVNTLGFGALCAGLAWAQPDAALRLNALADGLAVSVISTILAAMLWTKDASVISIRRALQSRNKLLRQREKELTRAAQHDPLTGVYNRVELFRLAELEIERARRSQTDIGAIMLDLDHFKGVNDEHGHQAGDAVLVRVAAALQAGIRRTDLLGRMGGEEFMLVLPHSDVAATRALADKLRRALRDRPVPLPGGRQLQVSVSCGVSSIPAGSRQGIDWLYASADHALYMAKRAGRNRVEDAAGLIALSTSDFQRLRK